MDKVKELLNGLLQKHEYVIIPQPIIAEHSSTSLSTVNRAIESMIDDGLVVLYIGNVAIYTMNQNDVSSIDNCHIVFE